MSQIVLVFPLVELKMEIGAGEKRKKGTSHFTEISPRYTMSQKIPNQIQKLAQKPLS